ncbi:MAG: hypothetical protein EBZ59_03405, partial [Planctomycetia bacterium]|nr:hypothetical protein [Planctomycetia bacterium]
MRRKAAARRPRRDRVEGGRQPERLEERKVMATFSLVSAYATSETPFFVSGANDPLNLSPLNESPQQFTLRFSPGTVLDQNTLDGNITIVRSGKPGDPSDPFNNGNDVEVTAVKRLVDDLPNQNQVVIRFAETLPDDTYQIRIGGGLKSKSGDTFNTSANATLQVRLDLGAFVVAVVPQPVSRVGAGLTQSRDRIDVYFNRQDRLDVASAQTAAFYRLFEVNSSGDDVSPLAPTIPTGVAYDAATGKAVLTFAAGAILDGKLYRLAVGGAETLVDPANRVQKAEESIPDGASDDDSFDNSSFATARILGALTAQGITVTGAITAPRATNSDPALRGTLATPAGPLLFPTQPGSVDEPGHRQDDVPVDSHVHGLPQWLTKPSTGGSVGYYNFQRVYGKDGQGNDLYNAITETQKQRVREVFELYSRYTGLRFIETPDDAPQGLTVATGDPRALAPGQPPAAVGGIASALEQKAIINSLNDWGASEYGGGYFQVAMHEIGHALGLAHSYDIPSIMGAGLTGEAVFPGDYDTVHLAQLYPADGTDVDLYKFTLAAAGAFSAETVIARPGQVALSTLDSVISLYREDTVNGRSVRTLVARNDDSFGRDSFVGMDLGPGTYYIGVSSAGNESFNPEVSDSGYGGRSTGGYQLKLDFRPQSTKATTIVDASGTLFDGDRDGRPGGTFNFWFNTASVADTIFVDKAAAAGGNGSAATPYTTIKAALDNVGTKKIIRIVGNDASNDPLKVYQVGVDLAGRPLADGATFNVPAGVTVMIDEKAIFKLRGANIDVGSSSPLVSRGGASLQVLGTPDNKVTFTSYHDDSVGGNADSVDRAPAGGEWGGIVLRQDSDAASKKAFVNTIGQAVIRFGGGSVLVDSQLDAFAPIQLESTRPTIAFNTITRSAGAAIAADPNSFEEGNGRVGPEIRGNTLLDNTTNGLFVKIRTQLGSPVDRLDVPARFKSTDIVYVLQENLFVSGGVGGYEQVGANLRARRSGRLTIDPGAVVKLQGSRIELERGTSQLIAEGTASKPVTFTSLADDRFGAGGTFDTNGNLPNDRRAGDWGGLVLDAGSKASIDHAYVAYGGGQTPIEGSFDSFNVIETHQGDLRVAHSRIENNAAGRAVTSRSGRGGNAAATIFVRGAQPAVIGNDFRDNLGAVVSINVNSLADVEAADPGRSTGAIDRDGRYDDNRGPLVRDNRLSYSIDATAGRPAGGATLGMEVRGEEVTVESVWDDVDVVHVLRNEVIVQNFHTATGVRLMSRPDASLIVKLQGANAGFTAAGYALDISDRIGGTVHVLGQPGFPVVLSSLKDDSVGASLDSLGRPTNDTNADGVDLLNNATGASTPDGLDDVTGIAFAAGSQPAVPAPGDWRSLKFLSMSNDRNVAVVQEAEKPAIGGIEANSLPTTAQPLGVLAPNFATGTNSSASAQEKSGDENRRLGFEVHGRIASDDTTDVDVYSFVGYSGSEVWIDIDKTSPSLDAMVELLDASGKVLARSADSQTAASLDAAIRGAGQDLGKDAAIGGDFYTVNPKDAGMRVVLPALPGRPTGESAQYYIRVRSQPRYEPATTGAGNGNVVATSKAAYQNDLADAAKVKSGVTSGAYELRVRLRQADEKPGSTVRYADIRYPTVGIDVQGLPNHSPLVGEAGEAATANDAFASAQYVGNLLESDRETISVAGEISSATDVDWYSFALNYEQIQSIGGVSDALKTLATVFDIDYADGFRGDLTLSVFDAAGKLIFVGRDSNVASDQPGAGQGTDVDDLSRGSVGKLDPFIGSVMLPAGNPTGGGSMEGADVPPTPSDPKKQLRYYVAVSSNQRLPVGLDAYFKQVATNGGIRLEPISSVKRVAEDHVGATGFKSGPEGSRQDVQPTTQRLFDTATATALALNVTPFTLSDVTLFVYTATTIETVDAMRGGSETVLRRLLVAPENPNGDIAMRSDGKLFQYVGAGGDNVAGALNTIDTVTGAATLVGTDNIPDFPAKPPIVAAIAAFTDAIPNRTSFPMPAVVKNGSFKGELNVSFADTTGATPVTRRGSWTITQAAGGALTFTPDAANDANSPEIDGANSRIIRVDDANPATPDAPFGRLTVAWKSKFLPVPDASVNLLNVDYLIEDLNAVTTDTVDAMAFMRIPGPSTAYRLFYSVPEGDQSLLFEGSVATGDASKARIGTDVIDVAGGGGVIGTVTGMAFIGTTMYGVDTNGNFFRFNSDPKDKGVPARPGTTVTVLSTVGGVSFQGLTAGPQNLQNGAFANMLFAIDSNGDLRAFSATDGTLQAVFDSDDDGVADATSIASGAAPGALGLAFSPLDINLWHPTTRRGLDAGHGTNVAPDQSRNTADSTNEALKRQLVDQRGNVRPFSDAQGGASMYFGLEQYVRPFGDVKTPYFNYQSYDGQYGVLGGAWQQDLSTNPDMVGNYNLPGGAYGSLVTNAFSLAGSTSNDKPTLYFSYFLQTENASSRYDRNDMRDSARVFISVGGGQWQVVASNNSIRSAAYTTQGELPAFASASSAASSLANQHVQELYDTSEWRQARVDLGNWAGQTDIRLRFDFSTAGELDGTQRDATGKQVNDIAGYANTTGQFSGNEFSGAQTRGANNTFEGFYVDDVIIGFAERGEMVTGAAKAQTGFLDFTKAGDVDTTTPAARDPQVPAQNLSGAYQLEIRRGTATGSQPQKNLSDVKVTRQFDTNADLTGADAGDSNTLREQGQFLIENNMIVAAATYGISIDAAARDPYTNMPVPGSPRNLPVQNGSRLVPGAVIANNLISGSGVAGIRFSGDAGAANGPAAAVSFGRIVNNTVSGGASQVGIGVSVSDNAAPTILNNLIANVVTGIDVDASSRSSGAGDDRTVIGTSAYWNVGTQVTTGVTQSQQLALDADPFVSAATGNFYLRAGSRAIDSSYNSLEDRAGFLAVKSAVGIAESPILAPDRDLFGQLRVDDPTQASFPGLGSNVFKDRGAIDRVDVLLPYLTLLQPLDGSQTSPVDLELLPDSVLLSKRDAQGITQFVLQLADNGVGIDKATVRKDAFSVTKNGAPLTEGTDYFFRYFSNNNRIVFESPSVFGLGAYVITATARATVGVTPGRLADLANNTLLPNKSDGTTSFRIELADAPGVPTGLAGVAGEGQVTLSWTAAAANGSPVTDHVI